MQLPTLAALASAVLLSATPITALAVSANPSLVFPRDSFGNCHGCSSCVLTGTFEGNCHDAVNRFLPGTNYAEHERFTVGDCYADWYCNGAYPVKDGGDIRNVFNYGIYNKAGCKACGEWWLDDGSNCHATVQAKGC